MLWLEKWATRNEPCSLPGGGGGGGRLFLTDSSSIHLHPDTGFVVPFQGNEANEMSGDWTVQVMFHHLISVSVACEFLKERRD